MAIRRHKASGSRSNRGKNGAQKPGGLSLGTARRPPRHQEPPPAIGEYLIRRLQDYGIRDVFGIPGDFVLQFYGMLEDSPIRVIGTRREDCAAMRPTGTPASTAWEPCASPTAWGA